MTPVSRSTSFLAAAMLLTLVGACTSGSSDPDGNGARTSIVPVQLIDVADRTGTYSEEFTLPAGTKKLSISTTCSSDGTTETDPGAVFAVEDPSGKSVLTFRAECQSSDEPVGSATDLDDEAAKDVVVRVTPDDLDKLTWSLTVTAA